MTRRGFSDAIKTLTAKANCRIVHSWEESSCLWVHVAPQVLPLAWDALHAINFDFAAAVHAVWLVVLVEYSCLLYAHRWHLRMNDCLNTVVVVSDQLVFPELSTNIRRVISQF